MLTTHNKLTKRSGIFLGSLVCAGTRHTSKQNNGKLNAHSLALKEIHCIVYCVLLSLDSIALRVREKRRDDRRLQRMKEKAEKEFI